MDEKEEKNPFLHLEPHYVIISKQTISDNYYFIRRVLLFLIIYLSEIIPTPISTWRKKRS